MNSEPQQEHHWLEKLVGDWTYEAKAAMAPGEPEQTFKGTESARMLGKLWVICDGEGESPGGYGVGLSIMTLGYDPAKGRYVGSFIGSTMKFMWLYDGQLDPSGTKLVLDSDGPSFTEEGKMGKYRDTIEFLDDDHRTLSSSYLGDDGSWSTFMTMHYRRA